MPLVANLSTIIWSYTGNAAKPSFARAQLFRQHLKRGAANYGYCSDVCPPYTLGVDTLNRTAKIRLFAGVIGRNRVFIASRSCFTAQSTNGD